MQLSMKTYLISHYAPQHEIPKNDHDQWPAHRRVRATTATRAIAKFHREICLQWNGAGPEIMASRHALTRVDGTVSDKSFTNRDFPILEVKVVA